MIIKMAVNGSGIRDTERVLGISKDTVMSVFNHFRLKPEDFVATESRYCG